VPHRGSTNRFVADKGIIRIHCLSWIASSDYVLLAMTLAVGDGMCRKGKNDCVEGVIHNKDSCSWILGSSFACPRMTGEKKRATPKDDGGECLPKERNVRAKDVLFVLDCFLGLRPPRNDASRGGVFL
jgi:hypothetical protein